MPKPPPDEPVQIIQAWPKQIRVIGEPTLEAPIGRYPVALFDILGFRHLLSTRGLDWLAAHYEQFIKQAAILLERSHPSDPEWLDGPWGRLDVFSDTLILTGIDGTELSCRRLLYRAWRLLRVAMSAGLPIRGAVSHGNMYANPHLRVFLGSALTRAYELEQSQDWMGVLVDPVIDQQFPDLFTGLAREHLAWAAVFIRHLVPFKDGTVAEHYVLNWRWNLTVKGGTRSLFSEALDASAQRKIDNTLRFARVVRSRRLAYPRDGHPTPPAIAAFWVGDSSPPFPHGDDL